MAPFTFLRSNQDRDKEQNIASSSSTTTTSIQSSDVSSNPTSNNQQSIQFTHPFTSTSSSSNPNSNLNSNFGSSINPSSAIANSNANANANANTNTTIASESPTSKYHPSRLLRRKASLNNKSNDTPTFTDSDPLPSSSQSQSQSPAPSPLFSPSDGSGAYVNGSNTNVHANTTSRLEPPVSPRRLPSSPRIFPPSPRGFFFDNANNNSKESGNTERDKFHTHPRRGSETARQFINSSTPSYSANNNNGLHSPTSSRRSAFVYNGRLTSEGDEEVVIIPSAQSASKTASNHREGEDLSTNLAALGLGSALGADSKFETTQTLPVSSSLPKVLDGGLGSGSGNGFGLLYKRSDHQTHPRNPNAEAEAEAEADGYGYGYGYNRPPTPPDSAKLLNVNTYAATTTMSTTTTPFYPTALSPPRRPMPRSPRAMANQNQRSQTPTSNYSNNRPETPPSVGMHQALSAVGGPSTTTTKVTNSYTASTPNLRKYSDISPYPPSSIHDQEYEYEHGRRDHTSSPTPGSGLRQKRRGSEKPKITAEWLARKPSSSSTTASPLSNHNRKHRPSLSVDHDRVRSKSNESPSSSSSSHILPSTPTRKGSLGESPKIISHHKTEIEASMRADSPSISGTISALRPKIDSSSSNLESDTDALSSDVDGDGQIGLNPRRRSLLLTPSKGTQKATTAANTGLGGYQVIVNCIDNGHNSGSNLKTDHENGEEDEDGNDEIKWEVIIKRQSNQSANNTSTSPLQLSTNGSIAQAPISASSINLSLALDQPTGKLVFISFPMDIHATPTRRRRPSTVTRSNGFGISSPAFNSTGNGNNNRPCTPPNQIQSESGMDSGLTRTPSSRRKPPPPWPSPKTEKPISPPGSPRDVFTPKKRGTPLRMGVDGDLLNKVTRAEAPE
ncbi:uncharacterized protein IL334_002172 [Kwoniella shivajii]|uniref:Uncharacterized protein n=1 Tax=Kwoniella shivajii TaxID=564305 RepID=A0ABZ1CTY4_9TREE|nr:hypothetical protein IL334_002172 [Kwoniella shivajii]